MRTAIVEGVNIVYEILGDAGPPVFLIPRDAVKLDRELMVSG